MASAAAAAGTKVTVVTRDKLVKATANLKKAVEEKGDEFIRDNLKTALGEFAKIDVDTAHNADEANVIGLVADTEMLATQLNENNLEPHTVTAFADSVQ